MAIKLNLRHIKLLPAVLCTSHTSRTFAVTNVGSEETIILTTVEVEAIIEEAGVVTSKTTGTMHQVQVQVVASIFIPAMSHLNMILPSNSIPHNFKVVPKLHHNSRQRKKKIVRICSDHPKSFEWKTRRLQRRMMKSRCHLQTDILRLDPRANRTRTNSPSLSRLRPSQLQLLRNPKYPKS